ncbi:hypothetical protein AAUPMB_20392 [Pasteurella multocida subsp. multocida str. Anand1_buffalo]|nr:hypothetical protein BMF22_09270 [Pasteurella multocida]EJS83402.1 hypothetical protein KCU_10588 [Pasteurella multocida subsp. multocida str. P52VAC]EJS85841.1 hypothetical protein AAUPMB_20392 [Pasteurella multocida subsp. multocida str. Anand1_buffalo]ERL42260.1 hypothetical protein B654_03576 [Pasteurella multocida subsp. multocida str. PMTB]KEP93675.1 hypothetical protein UQU_0205410 [Pasteurella multocida subsp. multocida VTCCBAA264]KLT47957.1 hypothetical protein PVACC_05315 [Pasteur
MNSGMVSILIGLVSTLTPLFVLYYVFNPKGKKWYMWVAYIFTAVLASKILNAILISVTIG